MECQLAVIFLPILPVNHDKLVPRNVGDRTYFIISTRTSYPKVRKPTSLSCNHNCRRQSILRQSKVRQHLFDDTFLRHDFPIHHLHQQGKDDSKTLGISLVDRTLANLFESFANFDVGEGENSLLTVSVEGVPTRGMEADLTEMLQNQSVHSQSRTSEVREEKH